MLIRSLTKARLGATAFALVSMSSTAFAFSAEPTPAGPGVQNQFSDPDAAIDNLADSAAGGSGTELTTGAQLPSGAPAAPPARSSSQDAEPVNSAWPAWMVWHPR